MLLLSRWKELILLKVSQSTTNRSIVNWPKRLHQSTLPSINVSISPPKNYDYLYKQTQSLELHYSFYGIVVRFSIFYYLRMDDLIILVKFSSNEGLDDVIVTYDGYPFVFF